MKTFAELFAQLDQATEPETKIAALTDYFARADKRDCLWTIALLSNRRPKRALTTARLGEWAVDLGEIPLWLFEASYQASGDLAETIALSLPAPRKADELPLTYWMNYIQELSLLDETDKKEKIGQAWNRLTYPERFIFNKLITGGFRLGLSQKLIVQALARHTGLEENILASRLKTKRSPQDDDFDRLIKAPNFQDDIAKPYPFCLAAVLEGEISRLGNPAEWQAERKWNGIRGQLIVRQGKLFVWSQNGELMTDKFPEYDPLTQLLPDGTLIEGEILPYKNGKPIGVEYLQNRIKRKKVSKKNLEEAPVILMAYDLLECRGVDIREKTMLERRRLLEELVAATPENDIIHLSPLISFDNWKKLDWERKNARQYHTEGLILKRKNAVYQANQRQDDWRVWKADPLKIEGVLTYAQYDRRTNLITDFTFALWGDDQLLTFTKASSGLTDEEYREITDWASKNTLERFGPVRSLRPIHVFEIAFEGISRSPRHKSGVKLRAPRISRWRRDKLAAEANTLADLHQLLG